METDVHRRTSPYNRRRTGDDLKVVACTCQHHCSVAIQSYLSEKGSSSSLELSLRNDNENVSHLHYTIKDVLCTVVLVCHHVVDSVINVTRDQDPETQGSIVIAGTRRELAKLQRYGIPSVNLESSTYCEEVLVKVSDVLHQRSLYDDFTLENVQTMNTYGNSFEMDQSETYDRIPYENTVDTLNDNGTYQNHKEDEPDDTYTNTRARSKQTLQRQEANQDETELKEIVTRQTVSTNETHCGLKRETEKEEEKENPYQHLLMERPEKLINLTTWGSAEEFTCGVTVLEEFCSPFHTYNKTEEKIVADINSGERATVVELIKHVHAVSIPSAVSQIDLRALSTLSDCYNNGIETRTAREIQNILFQTEVGRHNLEALLESVDLLLGVVRRRAASSDTLINTLPNVIVMLALVHHLLLSHSNKATNVSEMVRTKLKNFLTLLEEIEYPQTNDTEWNLLKAVAMMIRGLEKVMSGKKANRLQIGSWKDELQKDSCRTKIKKSLEKMAVFEQYSLIVRLIIELHLRLIEKHTEFLLASLKSIKSTMKKTDGPILYPLLVVVFRGVTSILNNHTQQDHHRDDVRNNINRTCIDMLKISLRSAKVSLECKQDLRENLNILLFHKSASVVSEVSTLMATESRFCLADKVYPYMKTILEPLSFSINSESQERQCLPRWEDITGTITGHKEVSVHVHLPANGTLDVHEYRRCAVKDVKTGIHYNTLEILKCLLGGEHHPNMKRLIAFQEQTIPMFYMTEKLSDASLSTYLLRERKNRTWLSVRTLGSIALDCVKAINFLHERKIIHRNITAASFSYRGDHETFVLSDLSIAKLIDDGSNGSGSFIQDIEGNLIPTRWSAPESLIDDRYDVKSDTWMLGQTLNEIFTHGCHPFPEMFTFEFDDLMDMVIFHEMKPRRYPCIPLPVHNIILQCVETKAHSRIKPKEVLEELKKWMDSPDESHGPLPSQSVASIANRSLNYPELDPNQKEPERGSTKQLKQLKNMRGNPRVSYYNTASKRRLSSFVRKNCIQEQNLTAPDHPIIKEKGLYLEIEEPVTYAFLRETFPRLCNKEALGELLHIVRFPPDYHKRECTNPEGLTHALLYRCKKADSLLKIAETCMLGDPEDNEMPYLEVVYELVQFVNAMHKNSWILRDLCCSTLYRSQVHDKVFMPRLGRMIKIEKRNSRIEACVIDKSTCVDDRRNWMPAEVIQSGQFSQASDVYMLAMTICQFYSSASLFKSNPMSSRVEAIPFCKVEPEKLLDTLCRGEVPEEPDSCPGWLFKIMKECWNRDSTQRPTTDYILLEIFKRLIYSDDSTFDSMSSMSLEDRNASAGSVLSTDSRKRSYARKLPNVPLVEETDRPILPPRTTDRPVPPPRPKRAKGHEYSNVSKTGTLDQKTHAKETVTDSRTCISVKQPVHGSPFTDMHFSVNGNDVETAIFPSNPVDSCVSCANSSDGSFVNTVDNSCTNPMQTVEKGATRAHVTSTDGHSGRCVHDKTEPKIVEVDIPVYLDFDQSPNDETRAKTFAVNNPSEEYNSTSQEKTAFLDDTECYQDFDQQNDLTEAVISRPSDTIPPNVPKTQIQEPVGHAYDYATTIPNSMNRCIPERSQEALPQVPGNHDISRTASTVTRASSIVSALSCANSEALVYDYADVNPLESSQEALPPVPGNHDRSRTASTVTRASSIVSTLSCANSEALVYDYAEVNPLQRNVNYDTGPLAGKSNALSWDSIGSHTACSCGSTISCANSSIEFCIGCSRDNKDSSAPVTGNDDTSSLSSVNIYENTSHVSRHGSECPGIVDDDGYEEPLPPNRTFQNDTPMYQNV